MHELGIMQNIVSTVETYARENRIGKVAKVIVEVGEISGVVPEALEFCFEVCTKKTVLEGAQLEIVRVVAVGRCKQCGKEFTLLDNDFTCTSCHAATWDIVSGRELLIQGLEVV